MASALVTQIRGGGKGAYGTSTFIVTAYFYGTDVPEQIDGQSNDVPVTVVSTYSLKDLKSAIITAVIARGAVLGLTVAQLDVDVIGIEHEST